VTMKLADTLMMLTLVVLSARVKAAVNSAHMAALKSRFMPKKKPRTATSTNLLSADKERDVAMCEAKEEVRAVVVLSKR
jgi:hypothetical protein